MVTLVAVFLTSATVAIAAFVNFHDFSGYAHGLADGDNNNGFVRDYIHRDNGNNGSLFTQRYQSGNPLGSDSCSCATLDRGISPSINECHESVDVSASSPALSEHVHYHANYCS